jgi:hypothetical protein
MVFPIAFHTAIKAHDNESKDLKKEEDSKNIPILAIKYPSKNEVHEECWTKYNTQKEVVSSGTHFLSIH